MVTRRQTLKVIVSSLFVPALDMVPFGKSLAATSGNRMTDPACSSCASSKELTRIFGNVLDSATLLKHVSLPRAIVPLQRSSRAGTSVQLVESSTGNLVFGIPDVRLRGYPSVSLVRYYNSASSADTGLGKGWSFSVDERITVSGSGATVYTAAGDVVQLQAGAGQSVYSASAPGLSSHRKLSRVDDNTFREELVPGIAKVYSKIGDAYHLSAFDYGQAGSVVIQRDANARLTAVLNAAAGYRIDVIWSEDDTPHITALKDSAGRSVNFNYGGSMLSGATDVTGAAWQYGYQGDQLASVVDPAGTEVLGVGYAAGKVSQSKTIAGATSYAYSSDAAGHPMLLATDGNGVTWSYSHNAKGQVTGLTSSRSAADSVSLAYDDQGFLTSTVSAAGTHQYKYDAQGRLVYSAKGRKWKQWQYSDAGLPQVITDAAGPVSFEYDGNSGLMSATSSRKVRTYTCTTVNGRVATLQNFRRSITFNHNKQGLLASFVDAKHGVSQFQYNNAGHLLSESMPGGYSAYANRNARGQLVDWSDSNGMQFTFKRDARGAVQMITNTKGEWARAERDASGRIVQLTNWQGQSRSFTYNTAGDLDTYTDATNRRYQVEYDPVSGKALKMVSLSGGAAIIRGPDGSVMLDPSVPAADAATPHGVDDGWQDPLNGDGLFGAFSGYSRMAATEIASSTTSKTPAALAMMIAAGASDTRGDDDRGDDDDDDDDDSDQIPPACSGCQTAYTNACNASYLDAGNAAQEAELAADLLCAATIEAPPVLLACVAAAEIAYQAGAGTATTNFNNCVSLVPQDCYSQCSGS
ncbi:RHS repeat protein [Dyella jejuensis]|uniref:RHS repeat protein n=1 Tax=Dyella jejuensis TaxID=1432009 RepID=A0ABW8JL70_9GAMM